jgi:hypothetical protein
MKYFYCKNSTESRVLLYHKSLDNRMDSKISAEFENKSHDSQVQGVDNYQVLLEYGVDL